jgi:NADPH:quinone reductase-like Zn-dependent oxidoreductase
MVASRARSVTIEPRRPASPADILVKVDFSGINFKDALVATAPEPGATGRQRWSVASTPRASLRRIH